MDESQTDPKDIQEEISRILIVCLEKICSFITYGVHFRLCNLSK